MIEIYPKILLKIVQIRRLYNCIVVRHTDINNQPVNLNNGDNNNNQCCSVFWVPPKSTINL